jgi:hypothetical protein
MYAYFLFFYFFYFFIFLFFSFIFLGLGPAQPTWHGLDPASPARSLALGKTKSTREVASRVHEQCEGN